MLRCTANEVGTGIGAAAAERDGSRLIDSIFSINAGCCQLCRQINKAPGGSGSGSG